MEVEIQGQIPVLAPVLEPKIEKVEIIMPPKKLEVLEIEQLPFLEVKPEEKPKILVVEEPKIVEIPIKLPPLPIKTAEIPEI